MGEDEYLTVPQAAERSGYTRKTIYRWLEAGVLTRYRVGIRGLRVSSQELDRQTQPRSESAGCSK
jgi:excisionase family DNA binding protein